MQLWLLFSIMTACLWAVGQVLSKKGFNTVTPFWNNVLSVAIGLFLYIPIALIGSNFHLTFPSPSILLLIFLTDIFYLSYFYAISKGKLALTGTLFETYPVFTIIPSFIFLHERILIIQQIGIVITILGGLLVAWPPKEEKYTVQKYLWVIWGLFGAALEGIGDFFAKVSVNSIGIYSQLFFFIILFPLVLLGNYIFDRKSRVIPKLTLKEFLPSLTGTGCIVIGTIFLFFAFQYGKATLITPVAAASPALMVILAILLLKEKITKTQILGIIATLMGVALVGLNA